MREREQARPDGGRGRDAAERELKDYEVVALVGEEVREANLLSLGAPDTAAARQPPPALQ